MNDNNNKFGDNFTTFNEVLNMAHQQGLSRVDTVLIQFPSEENSYCAIYRAEVETTKGTFSGHGDATPKNTNRLITPHLIRMAETRALGRALRFATNAPTLAEEIHDTPSETVGRNIEPVFDENTF